MQRITNSMLSSNYMSNMKRNLNNMQSLQNQLSSGKEISRPSDNPYKVSRSMQLHSEISANKQYNENIKDISNWLDTTDTALNQAGNMFARVRELLVTAGNGAYGQDERRAIQDEIKEKVNELAQVLNTNFDGAYIFGGSKSTSKPVMVDSNGKICYADKDGNKIETKPDGTALDPTKQVALDQIEADLNVEVSQGVLINYNKTAKDILEGNGTNIMTTLNKIIDNLGSTGDKSLITGECLGEVDNIINNLLQNRSEVGAMTNRMESAQSKNEDENLNMTDILSKTEDIDFTEKMMEYSVMQTIYMAALQTSAKVLPSTILDYLR
ncbi:flagellar hook-associated protein FlgL [Clostridium weizhouense]|uniref:Flagellar hook-associated protein FlgL n=1 Tax=Clostridium weizhouense TaxID=2859781 RepID=A0ABS7AJ70_9CLOT|nr:flagellar hook-associated protein FlgL [Clostridium weizhouense]MBW6408589.1 flagellar hook-associated protein FlgL [Clostridium weizhouense]